MLKNQKIKTFVLSSILTAVVAVPAFAASSGTNGYKSWTCKASDGVGAHTIAITRDTGDTEGGTKQTYGISAVGNSNSNYKWTQVTINGQVKTNSDWDSWVQTETLSVGGNYYTVYEAHSTR